MISENKIKHILSVARRCKELAEEQGLSEEEQDACFAMGFLHDIGYEELKASEDISEHGNISCRMIANFFRHGELALAAIRMHGKKTANLSKYDIILNTADLTVDYKGDYVSVQQRLNDIQCRHGSDSTHYAHAREQASALMELGAFTSLDDVTE